MNDLSKTPELIVRQVEAVAIDHYQHQRFDRAIDLLTRLVEMRPEQNAYWSLLGVCLRRSNKRPAALVCFRKAIELDGEDRNAMINMAETLCEIGQATEGLTMMRAIFDAGYDPQLKPRQQDAITRRAGAQLGIIAQAAQRLKEQLNEQAPS